MICTHLTGNLGDHIVRYTLCRSVADKLGYSWGINPTPSHDYLMGQSQLDMIFDLDYGEKFNLPFGHTPENFFIWQEGSHNQEFGSYYPFQKDIFSIKDSTYLKIFCGQDARYYDKEKITAWLQPKEIKVPVKLTDKTCIINIRGGEYKGISNLIIPRSYYLNAVTRIRECVEDCRFIIITDDVAYAESILPYPAYHYSIAEDYTIINQAKYLILSNSGFAIFPAWLNKNAELIIAPKFWARYNVSNSHWYSSDVWTFGFTFMDKEGNLEKYV